jgi:hypothetical protein
MALEKVKKVGNQSKVRIINKDVFKYNLNEADVIYLFLAPKPNERIRPKLENELKSTTRIVSNAFEIKGWNPLKVSEVLTPIEKDSKYSSLNIIYLYRMDKI